MSFSVKNDKALLQWKDANQGTFSLFPKEIGAHIFSYLTLAEKSKASSVCKYWKELLQPSLFEMLKGIDVNQYSIIRSFSQDVSSLVVVNKKSAFVSFSNMSCALLEFGEPNQLVKPPLKHFSHDCKEVLDQTDELIFLSAQKGSKNGFTKVTCVQKNSGRTLFNLEIGNFKDPAANRGQWIKLDLIVQFTVLQNDPLKLLIVDILGNIAIFLFEHDKLELKDFRWRKPLQNYKTAYYVKNNDILIQTLDFISIDSSLENNNEFYLYNLSSEKEIKLNVEKDACLLDAKHLIFEKRSKVGNTISRYEPVNGQIKLKYQLPFPSGKTFISGNLLIFLDFGKLQIINAEEGNEIFSLNLHTLPFEAACFMNYTPVKARQFGTILALMEGHNLLLIDLTSGTNIYKKFEAPFSFVDCSLKEGIFYFLYDSGTLSSLAALDLSESKRNAESEALSVSFQVNHPSDLPLQGKQLQELSTSHNQMRQKIATIVFAALTFLCASISVYFGIMQSINLSIGLGTFATLTGSAAGYAAFKLKQKHNL